jgi:hypothetical protein
LPRLATWRSRPHRRASEGAATCGNLGAVYASLNRHVDAWEMFCQPAVTLTRSHCDGEITTTDAVLSFWELTLRADACSVKGHGVCEFLCLQPSLGCAHSNSTFPNHFLTLSLRNMKHKTHYDCSRRRVLFKSIFSHLLLRPRKPHTGCIRLARHA